MRFFRKTLLILVSGLLVGTISSCKKRSEEPAEEEQYVPPVKDPLVIPTVDVENLTINLPAKPTYNQGSPRSEGDYDIIDLYEVSDFHGAVDYKPSDSNAYIGLSKLASYFDGKRAINPGGTLVLSSGDMFQGSADSNSTRGYMVNYCMNYMGFDAMSLGNHEFDWTDTWIKKNAELAYEGHTIPYLGINIYDKATGSLPSFLQKSTIVERGDYKIGIIGAMGNALESSILYSSIQNYEFVEEAELISTEAARLRSEEHCDVVVLLEHQGIGEIPQVTGVDAIFGGHAHENKTGTVGTIPAAATKNYGRGIAHIGLKINKSTKEVSPLGSASVEGIVNATCEALPENAGIQNIMSQYAPSINSIKNIELATAVDDLKFDKALKNICTRTMFDEAEAVVKANPTMEQLDVLCAFHNVNGGIRDDIRAGKVTYGSVYSAFPFDNEVVLIKASGTLLKQKLVNMKDLGVCRTFQLKTDIDSSKDYYVVATDFLALSNQYLNSSASGLKEMTDADLIRTGLIVRDVVANKIYKLDKIKSSDFPNSEACYKNIPMSF